MSRNNELEQLDASTELDNLWSRMWDVACAAAHYHNPHANSALIRVSRAMLDNGMGMTLSGSSAAVDDMVHCCLLMQKEKQDE
jgi:hypothetical protein